MACQGCINRQRRLVDLACKRSPNGKICARMKARLEKMIGPLPETKK